MSTPESHDLERLRAALASLAEDEQWPEPDVERIFAAVHGQLDAEQRRAVVDELVRNPRAAPAWRLARELAPEGATASDTDADANVGSLAIPPVREDAHGDADAPRLAGPRAARPAIARRTWTWAAVAAAALLVAALGTQLRVMRPETPAYRGAESRRIASRLPADVALSRARPILRWTPVDGARYRVRILTSDLELIEEAEDLAAPEYRVSDDAIRRIPAGGRLLWQAEARVPGTTPVTSPTFSVPVE